MDARGAGREAAGTVRNYCYYKEIAAEPAHDSEFFYNIHFNGIIALYVFREKKLRHFAITPPPEITHSSKLPQNYLFGGTILYNVI